MSFHFDTCSSELVACNYCQLHFASICWQEFDQLLEQQKEIEEKIAHLEANPPR